MLTSAAGILANLKDDRQDLKGRVMLTRFALKKLDQIVGEFWHEISDSIQTIEVVHEDKDFPQVKRKVARQKRLNAF